MNFYFGSGALTFFFETFLGGRVVGKSDFNENPVVSLDFDFSFVNKETYRKKDEREKGTILIFKKKKK